MSEEEINENIEEPSALEDVPTIDSSVTMEEDVTMGDSVLEDSVAGQPAQFSALEAEPSDLSKRNLDLIYDINVEVNVELGRTSMLIKDVLELSPGSVLELNKLAGETVDVFINNSLVAKGEVVVISENFGVRITEIIGAAARIQNLGKGVKK